jgi:hypothetical protein
MGRATVLTSSSGSKFATGTTTFEHRFTIESGEPMLREWTRRSVDVSAYIGQTIRVAFVEADNQGLLNVHLDEVRLEVITSSSPVYRVLLGRIGDSAPMGLLGTSRTLVMPYADLSAGTAYRWQVMTVENEITNSSLISEFVVGDLGPFDRFLWSGVATTQHRGTAFASVLKAKDASFNTITNCSGVVLTGCTTAEGSNQLQPHH